MTTHPLTRRRLLQVSASGLVTTTILGGGLMEGCSTEAGLGRNRQTPAEDPAG